VKHPCHAIGCTIEVPPRMLMCRVHWYKVPRELQRRVWATYVEGQEIRKDPTEEYMEASQAAIDAVNHIEKRGKK